jgi:hypothetical protein
VDFLFGRYNRAREEDLEAYAKEEVGGDVKFEFPSDLLPSKIIRLGGDGQQSDGNANPDERIKPTTEFIEIGPSATF